MKLGTLIMGREFKENAVIRDLNFVFRINSMQTNQKKGKLTLAMLYRILLTTPNALLSIAVCSARDALLGIVSIYKAGYTYTGQLNQARKCGYLKQGIRSISSVASSFDSNPFNMGVLFWFCHDTERPYALNYHW